VRNRSLRQILTTITLIGLLPMAGLLGLLIYQSYVSAENSALYGLKAATASTANQYKLYLADAERQFKYLSDVPDISVGNRQQCEKWMRENLPAMAGLNAWYRLAPDGTVTCASKPIAEGIKLDSTFDPAVSEFYDRVDIMPVRLTRSDGQHVLSLRKMYFNNGKPFQIGVSLDAQWFLKAVESVARISDQKLFLVREDGEILLQLPDYTHTPKGRLPSFNNVVIPENVPLVHEVAAGLDGTPRVASTMTIHQFADGRRVFLSISVSPDAMFYRAQQVIYLGVGVLILGVFGVLLAHRFLFRRFLSRPIQDILSFSKDAARGQTPDALELHYSTPLQLVEIADAVADLTQQQEERAAALSEALDNLERAEGIARMGHWRLDLATAKVEWSDGVYALHGLSRETYQPNLETAINHYHPEDRDEVARAIAVSQETSKPFDFEKRILRADGTHLYVRSRGQPSYDKQGNMVAMFGIIIDIDAPKKAERELKRAQLAAQQLADARASFLASASHEVKTPLTAMLGIVDGLRQEELTPAVLKQIDLLDAAGQMLTNVIGDLLDSASADTDTIRLVEVPTNPEELVRQCFATFRVAYKTRHVAFEEVIIGDAPDCITIDAQRLRQVIFNLLSNAFKHTHKGGITLKTEFHTDAMSITVSDTGPGIHPFRQPHIFDRFNSSGPSGTDERPGTGLGLHIVKTIIGQMGGDIRVKSALGEGSSFIISLPYKTLPPRQKRASATQPSHARAKTEGHILVVEDNPVNQKLLSAFLSKIGCSFTIEKDGQCAMELLLTKTQDQLPQLILVDVNMPRMNGIDFAEFVRAQLPGGADIPMYLVTADVLADHENSINRLNISGSITKPLDFKQLRDVVYRHLDYQTIKPAA